MQLQYLKDSQNNTTAVVIPIRDWETITRLHQDIKLMVNANPECKKEIKPSDYRGCISSETANKMNSYIEESRNEWNNDF